MVKEGLDCGSRTRGVLIAQALLPNRIGRTDLDGTENFQHLTPANTCDNFGGNLKL